MKYAITIEIECGEKTCSSELGKFCKLLKTTHYGTVLWCSLFDVGLDDEMDGKLQRCPQCIEHAERIGELT